MTKFLCNFLLALSIGSGIIFNVHAEFRQQNIPDTLKPWTNWVLRDNPEIQCPHLYNANEHFCAYPSSLNLDLDNSGGSFDQSWTVYNRSWIYLPGNSQHWPQDVSINNKSPAVVSRNGRPSIELDAGQYRIQGKFSWQQPPESLQLPANTGLVYVVLDGTSISQPDIRNNQLWLNNREQQSHENNRLALSIYRKITDSQPMKMTTMVEMDVAGLQREALISGPLLQDFTVSALHSDLPARIDQNGQLRVQLRPGHWVIYVESINNSAITAVALPAFDAPWPQQEIWVFEHQAQLRQVQIKDKNTIDPQQTQLPAEWKQLPSYSLTAGEILQWSIIKRGDPQPEPDQLNLRKSLWLDFSGAAFTVKDEITGTLSQHWRLNVTPDVSLGQVLIDNQPQTITRLDGEATDGVELRHGQVDLVADSRVNAEHGQLSASGWQSQFNKVTANLNLPMGYRLFSVSGAHAPGSWIDRWTLLDLFLVLITAIACYRLWGKTWGIVALSGLVLIWHENAAPQMIWLNMIITIALINVLSAGRLLKALTIYRNLLMLVLILSCLVFVILQARTALYPQLEEHDYAAQVLMKPLSEPASREEKALPQAAMVDEASSYAGSYLDSSSRRNQKLAARQSLMIDPEAMIQTGPGLPNWRWHSYNIKWDGPVQQNQTIGITLISPALHRSLNILRILFITALLWRLFDIPSGGGRRWRDYLPTKAHASWLLLPIVLLGIQPDAQANFPSKQMLDDLKQYVTQADECLPQCASIESLQIHLSGDKLSMDIRAHASKDVALPLPVPINKWLPAKVLVDLKQPQAMFRHQDQSLWLVLPAGVHRLQISGSVARLSELKIDFQLKPQHIGYQLSGWSADITGEQLKQAQSLGFQRLASANKTVSQPIINNDIPVFAEVTRYLELGLDWYVTTQVKMSAGNALPAIMQIPLIDGESVITEGITVKNNLAIITLNQNTRFVQWRSTLPKKDSLTLTAASDMAFNEIWQLNSSPIWHIEYEGIPVIYHQRQGQQWQPEWHPWPGENIRITISRPKGISGNTKTIEQSKLTLTPGESLTGAQLTFNLRSSLGGQHRVSIPVDSELMSVSIDDTHIPARLNNGTVTLPISPGSQNITMEWREPRGISNGRYVSSAVDLGSPSVNANLSIKPGYQRWVLFAGGPQLGPAVLFWGVFVIIVVIAIALGRIKDMPLNVWHWLLLGIGLSASAPAAGVLIVGWLLALRTRGQLQPVEHGGLFNAFQLVLLALTALSLMTLFFVIQQGLLGTPDMQITGNQSGRYLLNWYADRSDASLPTAWIISVPLYVYRVLMLLWAIWLAFALLRWLRWGWNCYTSNGYWRDWHWSLNKPGNSQSQSDKK